MNAIVLYHKLCTQLTLASMPSMLLKRFIIVLCLCFSASLWAANAVKAEPTAMDTYHEQTYTQKNGQHHISAPKSHRKIPLTMDDLEELQDTRFEFEKPSALENLYSGRIVDELSQFGYDLFDQKTDMVADNQTLPAGMVQDDYILSSGDKLDIIIRGQENSRETLTINNQGLLITDLFPPISAAGRTLSDVRSDLERESGQLHNLQVFISLSGIRQIHILVAGHVNKPGRQTLTAFHTVLDALIKAGGIDKTGSLRQIRLIRDGKTHIIDIYQLLLLGGGKTDMPLHDGDRIIVPPIGPTIAVSGSVKRPGIFEILDGKKLSLAQSLGLAGGVLAPGQNRYMKLEFLPNGDETVEDIKSSKKEIFGDGTILMVVQSEQKRAQQVTLSGHTRQPGTHDLDKNQTLSKLIDNERVLGQDIYPLIGVIERRDPDKLTRKLIGFSPRQVLKGQDDQRLLDSDIIHLFSAKQITALSDEEEQKDNEGSPLLQKVSLNPKGIQAEQNIDDKIIASFLKERFAFVRGAVRQPGAYPVMDGTSLSSVLAVAGGKTLEANAENIEVTKLIATEKGALKTQRQKIDLNSPEADKVVIGPGDTVRINQKFNRIEDQSVTLLGEVNNPGQYDLMPGDTLLSLLERAGGLTRQAYPDGAIFSRASERKREEIRFRSQARDLELKLAASLQQADEDDKPDMAQVNATQRLIAELKDAKAVGRITVEADPATLSAYPGQNILLEAGDRIFIPKRPLTVRTGGEVLSPAALQFEPGKDAGDYIYEAGGTTYYADKSRAFVIYPDGSAAPLRVSAWEYGEVKIPPGSTIIVPRDPKPFDFLDTAERISQVLANLAVTGLYIDAISDDN